MREVEDIMRERDVGAECVDGACGEQVGGAGEAVGVEEGVGRLVGDEC